MPTGRWRRPPIPRPIRTGAPGTGRTRPPRRTRSVAAELERSADQAAGTRRPGGRGRVPRARGRADPDPASAAAAHARGGASRTCSRVRSTAPRAARGRRDRRARRARAVLAGAPPGLRAQSPRPATAATPPVAAARRPGASRARRAAGPRTYLRRSSRRDPPAALRPAPTVGVSGPGGVGGLAASGPSAPPTCCSTACALSRWSARRRADAVLRSAAANVPRDGARAGGCSAVGSAIGGHRGWDLESWHVAGSASAARPRPGALTAAPVRAHTLAG